MQPWRSPRFQIGDRVRVRISLEDPLYWRGEGDQRQRQDLTLPEMDGATGVVISTNAVPGIILTGDPETDRHIAQKSVRIAFTPPVPDPVNPETGPWTASCFTPYELERWEE